MATPPVPSANDKPKRRASKAKGRSKRPTSPSDDKQFDQEHLIKTVIAVPLLEDIQHDEAELRDVIIDVNIRYSGERETAAQPSAAQPAPNQVPSGRVGAKQWVSEWVPKAISKYGDKDVEQGVREQKSQRSQQYVYAKLQGKVIRGLVEMDQAEDDAEDRCIYHVWPDFLIKPLLWKSVPTVKADACQRAFVTTGKGIVWAVLDSGVSPHPHFNKHKNLDDLPSPLKHMDFTKDPPVAVEFKDLQDEFGHGTHVAGIIAGELESPAPNAIVKERDSSGKVLYSKVQMPAVVGVAPQCKIVSYKVITGETGDPVSNVIAAIDHIQEINGYGREIIIHGVNLSLGYDFQAEWFACGQSPICVEVNRLVKQGVYVVIAAGNTGKGFSLTINDPGNAQEAITVGSTHREMPHTYGVSYFSSKGPTGDGRRKPDLLAPGERILSCGAGPDLEEYKKKAKVADDQAAYYIERSGTSMAAPHISGMIAGILSVRSEFKGRPEDLKKLLLNNCTDLGREPGFQGYGLADMMRTIQAI